MAIQGLSSFLLSCRPVENLLRSHALCAKEVHLLRFTSEKGFELRPARDGTHIYAVPAHSSVSLEIGWQPKSPGSVRESLYLKWVDNGRLQVVLHGAALAGRPPAGQNAGYVV